jgi:hypothetical protein
MTQLGARERGGQWVVGNLQCALRVVDVYLHVVEFVQACAHTPDRAQLRPLPTR